MPDRFYWHGREDEERQRICAGCFRKTEDPAMSAMVTMVINEHGYIFVVCKGCGAREPILVNMP
jgi:hypothetical protein